MNYLNEDELTLTAFLWAKWLEADADGINILVITPEREAQEARMKASLQNTQPACTVAEHPYYHTAVLAQAWQESEQTDGSIEAGVHEITKLKLVPALPDLIQKGEYLGQVELRHTEESDITALHFFRGRVSLAGAMITMGVPVMQDKTGNKFYDLGPLDIDEDYGETPAPGS